MAKLTPTVVTDKTIGDVLFDGARRRPVLAINDDGEQVVCCRRTAKTNGWEIIQVAYSRAEESSSKKTTAAEDFEAPAKKTKPAAKKVKLNARDLDALL